MTWRCAAHQPRFAPFHLRFHPLLRRSFGFSFCSFSFSPFASSYLRRAHFVNQLPLLFRFSSYFLPFLSFFFSLSLYPDRLIFLLQPSPRLLEFSHYHTYPRFPVSVFPLISPSRAIPPNSSATAGGSCAFDALLGEPLGEQRVIIKIEPAKTSPAHSVRYRFPRTVSPIDCLRPHLILLLPFFSLLPGQTYRRANTESHAPGNLRSELARYRG